MAKQDMNRMVENFFAKKENLLSESTLEELVRKEFDRVLTEATKEIGDVLPKSLKFDYNSIPEIPVSEIAWSALETRETGETVSDPQRARLEEYLKNIQGNSIEEKILGINKFYKADMEEIEKSGLLAADSRTSKIQKVISYLVFLKTLTTIITNFNAASAGFSFESFLGVLLGGKQISTGGKTIADLQTGNGEYISLKLYSEKAVKVGGSFVDLANDMMSKPFIRYIVAVKELSGQKLKLQGTISFYSFKFDINNIIENMVKSESSKSKNCVRIPIEYIKSNGKKDFSDLKRKEVPQEEVMKIFNDNLSRSLTRKKIDLNAINIIKRVMDRSSTEQMFLASGGGRLGYAQSFQKEFLKTLVLELEAKNIIDTAEEAESAQRAIEEAVKNTFKKRMELSTDTEMKKRFDALKGGWASPEDSAAFYSKLNDEQKKQALKNTYGYISTSQFEMSLLQVFQITGKDEKIGEIVVGRSDVERIINNMSKIINQQVFEIFQSLNVLTSNINSYFANGLKDDTMADQAQEAALNIDKKTEEIQTQSKGQ